MPATPRAEGSCQPFLRAKLTATETKLRKSYKPIYGDSRVIVDFSCETVEQISQIDLERPEPPCALPERSHFDSRPRAGASAC
ncbi:MAG TPA: hypothetical protein VJV78_43330 [Polyangiales bacterium]|nr:hypothetical protein [Polyangiales bacterium]